MAPWASAASGTRRTARQRPVRRVLVRHFAALGVVVVAVTLVVVWRSQTTATAEARATTERNIELIARELAAPLTMADLTADPASWASGFERRQRTWTGAGQLRAIKVWSPTQVADQGLLVYSTVPDEAGEVADLGEESGLFGTTDVRVFPVGAGHPMADPDRDLFEAYVGFTDRSGLPFVLEVYKSVRKPDEIRDALLRDWLPISVGGVLLLGLASLPLSVRTARRVAEVERERQLIAQRALDAAAVEHRRIAIRLHDRVIQDLAGAGLLAGALRRRTDLDGDARATAERLERILAKDVQLLRDLLDSPHTAEWQDKALAAALAEWCAEIGLPASMVRLDVPPELRLTDSRVALGYRLLKEALRNVAKHAGASEVLVRIRVEPDPPTAGPATASPATASPATAGLAGAGPVFVAEVVDDGVGMPADLDPRVRPGHAGLRLMEYTAREAGGDLVVRSSPGAGTTVTLTLPLDPESA